MPLRRRAPRWIALLLAVAVPAAAAQGLDAARQQVQQRDYPAAQRTLEARLATAPDDDDARFLLARVLAWQGRSEQALPLYERLLARSPDQVDYLLGQGQALLWAHRPQDAVAVLERAQGLAPDYADVQQALAQARITPAGGAAAGAAGATATAAAPAPAARERTLEYSARHEWLNQGLVDWRTQRLDFTATARGRVGGYGALVDERRFGLRDHGLEAGLVLPLGAAWTLQPEAGRYPGADFVPRWYADLRLQRVFAHGWVGAASVRRSDYRDTRVERLALAAERYVGAWRGGYTLNLTEVDGRTLAGHGLALDRYYGQRSVVGVRVTLGREEALQGTDVVASDIQGFGVSGRHWFAPRWALHWDAGLLRQGDLYTRRGLTLGLQHAF